MAPINIVVCGASFKHYPQERREKPHQSQTLFPEWQGIHVHGGASGGAEQGMLAYPEATDFLEALEKGMPESSGCAIGFDRLCMIFCDSYAIAEVIFE